MRKIVFVIGLVLCPFAKGMAQVPLDLLETAIRAAVAERAATIKDTTKKIGDSTVVMTYQDSLRADSLLLKKNVKMLEAISIRAPRPIYSMEGEVVNYNVAEDETIKGLTALDALQNAPSVEVDIEGNITMRGSSKVEIWINGYPTHMNGPTLKVYLEQLPADAVDRIEVIKNPSAKYMVDEDCHIINIVTSSKIRNSHFLSLGLGGSSQPSLSPMVSYVFKNEKLTANAYLGFNYSRQHSTDSGWSVMRQEGAYGMDTTAMRATTTETQSIKNNNNLFLNANYQIDSMNDLTLFAMALAFPTAGGEQAFTDGWYYFPALTHYTFSNRQESDNFGLIGMANVRWKHRFDNEGHNLSVSLYDNLSIGSSYRREIRDYERLEGTMPDGMVDFNKTHLGNSFSNGLTLSSDYNRPLGLDDELSMGISITPTSSRNVSLPCFFDSSMMSYDKVDSLRRFEKKTQKWLTSASASWRHKWKNVTMTIGLRGYLTSFQFARDSRFPYDTAYSQFYLKPSFGLTYRTPSMHYFRFNYAMSTALPSPEQLSGGRLYGEDSYIVGNPALKPSRAHNLQLSWNRYFASSGSVGIESYANLSTGDISTCDEVSPGIDPYLGRLVSYSVPYNVGSSFKAGVEGNVTYRPTAWLNFRLYANLYRSGYEIDHPKAGYYKGAMTSYSFRLNCWANIAKKVRVNLSGNYGSPTQGLFMRSQGSYRIDLGANADFWEKRLSVVLNVSDLFNWNRSQTWNTGPYLLGYSNAHTDSRFVSLSVTLRFGKMELQRVAREEIGS